MSYDMTDQLFEKYNTELYLNKFKGQGGGNKNYVDWK